MQSIFLVGLRQFDTLKEIFSRLVGQFYTIYQEPNETVAQFIISFQMLHSQLTKAPLEDKAKVVFLAALWEPLRTMIAMLDFRTNTIDQVIDRVLEIAPR